MLFVRLLNRDNLTSPAVLPGGVSLRVLRHSTRTMGGPYEAEIEASGDEQAMMHLANCLRYGVEIYNDAGDTVWWGYVNEVRVGVGALDIGLSMTRMANMVSVAYTAPNPQTGRLGDRQNTPPTQDDGSVSIYGTKELTVSAGSATTGQACLLRDRVLNERKYPLRSVSINARARESIATLSCRGWFDTLGWRSYSAAAASISYLDLPDGFNTLDIESRSVTKIPTFLEDQTIPLGTPTSQRVRFRYTPTGTEPQTLKRLRLRLAKNGTPTDDMLATIYGDNGGTPGSWLGELTIPNGQIGVGYAWINIDPAAAIWVMPGQYVHVVLSRTGAMHADNYFAVAATLEWATEPNNTQLYSGSSWIYSFPQSDAFFEAIMERDESCVALNATTSQQRVAASFVVPGSQPSAVGRVTVVLQRIGNIPGDIVVSVCANNAGVPGTVLDSVSVPCAELPLATSQFEFTLSGGVLNSPGMTRWIQLQLSHSVDPGMFVRVKLDGYAANSNSSTKIHNGSAWSDRTPNGDLLFAVVGVQETTVQATNVAAFCGQFITGVDIETNSGAYADPFASDTTGLDFMVALLSVGSTNGRQMLAEVTRKRRLRIWEEPARGVGDYLIGSNGTMRNRFGASVPKDSPIVGVWVKLLDVHIPSLDVADFSVFIEAMEYTASNDRLIPKARNATGAFDVEAMI